MSPTQKAPESAFRSLFNGTWYFKKEQTVDKSKIPSSDNLSDGNTNRGLHTLRDESHEGFSYEEGNELSNDSSDPDLRTEGLGQNKREQELHATIARQQKQLCQGHDDLLRTHTIEQELRATIARQQEQLNQCQDGFFQMDAREQELQAIIARQQEQLSQCQDDLFRIQPTAQIPETQIVAQYEELCQSISSWTDNVLYLFEQRQDSHAYFKLDSGTSNRAVKLLSSIPEAVEYYVSALIHQWLQEHLLGSEVYAFGLTMSRDLRDAKSLVQEMEKRMSSLQPPRGKSGYSTSIEGRLTSVKMQR